MSAALSATKVAADAIVGAMLAGDYYATTGVELTDVQHTDDAYTVHIAAEDGVDYTTVFVGTRTTDEGIGEIGEVLGKIS